MWRGSEKERRLWSCSGLSSARFFVQFAQSASLCIRLLVCMVGPEFKSSGK